MLFVAKLMYIAVPRSWGGWGDWLGCQGCGGPGSGVQYRYRSCNVGECGDCPGSGTDSQSCDPGYNFAPWAVSCSHPQRLRTHGRRGAAGAHARDVARVCSIVAGLARASVVRGAKDSTQ